MSFWSLEWMGLPVGNQYQITHRCSLVGAHAQAGFITFPAHLETKFSFVQSKSDGNAWCQLEPRNLGWNSAASLQFGGRPTGFSICFWVHFKVLSLTLTALRSFETRSLPTCHDLTCFGGVPDEFCSTRCGRWRFDWQAHDTHMLANGVLKAGISVYWSLD